MKRSRSRMMEGTHANTVTAATMEDAYKSNSGLRKDSNSGIAELENEKIESPLEWNENYNGVGLDIEALISEYGGFDDLFEDDIFPLGEPPGVTGMEDPFLYAENFGNVSSSVNMIDVLDQLFLPVGSPPSENSNQPLPSAAEILIDRNKEVTKGNVQSASFNHMSSSSNGELDHVMKGEAMMTYAVEFRAVEVPLIELSSSIVRSPYVPASWEGVYQNSSYGATTPFYKSNRVIGAENYYSHVKSSEASRVSVMRMMLKRMH